MFLYPFLMVLWISDYNHKLILLSEIKLSGGHCILASVRNFINLQLDCLVSTQEANYSLTDKFWATKCIDIVL